MALRMSGHPSRSCAHARPQEASSTGVRYRRRMEPSSARTLPVRKPLSIEPLVLGASGLVGGAIYQRLRASGHAAVGTYHTHRKMGLKPHDLAQGLDRLDLDTVANPVVLASALTHVDYCETHPEEARERNVEQVRAVVDWCRRNDRALLFFSS